MWLIANMTKKSQLIITVKWILKTVQSILYIILIIRLLGTSKVRRERTLSSFHLKNTCIFSIPRVHVLQLLCFLTEHWIETVSGSYISLGSVVEHQFPFPKYLWLAQKHLFHQKYQCFQTLSVVFCLFLQKQIFFCLHWSVSTESTALAKHHIFSTYLMIAFIIS